MPGVAGPALADIDGLELLCIGSARNLQKRGREEPFPGPTGSSTLRRALIALLMTAWSYTTRWTTDRVVPIETDEERLSVWMREHLRVRWAEHPVGEDVEAAVIHELRPPLNQRTTGRTRSTGRSGRRGCLSRIGESSTAGQGVRGCRRLEPPSRPTSTRDQG